MSNVGDQIRIDELLKSLQGKDISNLTIIFGNKTEETCKMPSRTYIQMWVKLYESSKLQLPLATYRSLKKSALYLDEDPESIEGLINYRRRVLSVLGDTSYILQIHMVMMEMLYVASLKGEKLHIYPGGRGGNTLTRTLFQVACVAALDNS